MTSRPTDPLRKILPSQKKGEKSMEKIPPELIGRAVQDPEFRRRLLADPKDAVAVEGYELDEEQIEALEQLDPEAIDKAIEALVGELDSSKWA